MASVSAPRYESIPSTVLHTTWHSTYYYFFFFFNRSSCSFAYREQDSVMCIFIFLVSGKSWYIVAGL